MTTYTIAFENGPAFPCGGNTAVAVAMKRFRIRTTMLGCRGGGCGVCRVRVVDGSYHTTRMSREHVTQAEEAEGYALGCCLYPESDLVLAAAPRTD
jgi:ferredoxin